MKLIGLTMINTSNMLKISFEAGAEKIAGFVLEHGPEQKTKPTFMFLHGAGTGNKERVLSFSDFLVENGVSILAIDFSGHGESSGTLKESSLAKRVNEAKTAIELFTPQSGLTICGSSMGGYVGLKMLEYFDVKNLILLAPAIYNRRALNVRFDSGFTEIIREPESWKDSDALELLEKFTGNLLIVIGQNDQIIPAGVVPLLDQYSQQVTKKEIIFIPDCGHAVHSWICENPKAAQPIKQKILEYSL